MKIGLRPLYAEYGASSRMRVYTLCTALKQLGHDAAIGGDGEVVLVQKDAGRNARPAGARLVLFDCDDMECYSRIPEWCDVVTTDTEGHADALRECTAKPVEIVPDPIDFCPDAPLPHSTGTGGVWFGFYGNYHSVRFVMREAVSQGEKCRAISNAQLRDTCEEDGVEFVEWHLDTFVSELRKSAYALLSHEGADPGKSNNKMICALTLGLDVEVSNTPEYSKLWREIAALPFEQAQQYVWERYHPRAVAQRWLEVVGKYAR